MPNIAYATTRKSLHGAAELLLAGPQRRINRSIKLTVIEDGFATGPLPGDPSRIAVRGSDLVVGMDGRERVFPLKGSFRDLAAAAGIDCGPPDDAYPPASGCSPSDHLEIDPAAAQLLYSVLRRGDSACRLFSDRHAPQPLTPVLWPEHFDVGVVFDAVNYGVSPGDELIAEPYAYVGPHVARAGSFWDQPFGSARLMSLLPTADAVLAYFEEGYERARHDPLG